MKTEHEIDRREEESQWPDERVELTELAWEAERLADNVTPWVATIDRGQLFDWIVARLQAERGPKIP